MKELDVLIIGAGTAGQTAAFDLVAEGYRVAVVEKSAKPGGVCALYGCQAKKWFYEVTEIVARSRHLQGLGITVPPTVSWSAILQAKNSFTSQVPASTVANLKGNGVEYLEGEAVFTGPDTVMVNGTAYKPRYTIIATGAMPMPLPIEGHELLATSNDFLDLEHLPKRITFIGGGFISFEFAHFAARLGVDPGEVNILEAMDRPLGPFDTDMVVELVKATRAEGIQVRTGISIESIARAAAGFVVHLASGQTIETDLVVHGAGRVADIEGLNLQAAGITFNRRGIEVDGHMTTSNPRVFAVGDSAATLQLARVADQEAHVAAAAIIGRGNGEPSPSIDYRAAPAMLFTYPMLGLVGKTEAELIKEGIKYWRSFAKEVSWPTYRRVGMQHAAYKILVDGDSKILGAHILADNATGLINTFKQAMLDGTTVAELHKANIMSPYPSRESDIVYMLEPLLD
ncbi:dihydrolipoyl dehydrogenase family protein [Desulfocastanea catecholica]